ncbi:MAG: helix-turn-helix domain-containing protein [Patescibacteria group bacterium]|nr:helix-turn-helix domain-containing protein [Patescibacteria group bacterium]
MESTHFESLYPDTSRFSEIEKILGFVRNGNSCQLIGLPGIGRSNLLGLLTYNTGIRINHLGENQKWFHFVLLNFSEVRKKPLLGVMKFIFLSLLDSLRERKMNEDYKKVNEILNESLKANDELVLFQGLKRAIDFLCIEKELTVVFLFDRFEEYIPMLSSEFFTNLRVIRNRAKYRFSVVFSLSRSLDDLVEPMLFADFYEFLAGNIVYLPLFDKPGLDFRISYLEKVSGKKINKKNIDSIIELTGAHGKLTRLCLEAILATSNWQLATREGLSEFLLEQKGIQGSLFEIWSSLNPEEQKMISANQLTVCDYLTNIGLVKDGKISVPLFADFIPTLLRQGYGRAQQLVFDSQTNVIKKGDLPLSEILTSSEFKLLKYLLENQGKILDRNEVIKSVWQDTKSVEGVTDQALDQLIFRLRKKIEEDPNNPGHLQTIKGRGIRFVP